MNVKRIELYDLMYWDSAAATPAWKALYANDGSANTSLGPGSQKAIVIYNNEALGWNPANPYAATILWDYFAVNDGSGITDGWTIFGASPLVPTTAVSIKIRYRLRVTDMADPANVISATTDYYQIIKASYPTDHITFSTGGTTGPWAPVITVYLPGISTVMVANPTPLFTWLDTEANWQVTWTRPDGSTKTYIPSAVAITNSASAISQYGGARVACTLTLPTLAIGQNGTHTLSVSLLPNDQEESGYFQFADGHTWTATVAQLTPTVEAPLYLSFDSGVFMQIEFTQ